MADSQLESAVVEKLAEIVGYRPNRAAARCRAALIPSLVDPDR